MDLELNEFQSLLRTSARDFLNREAPEERVRAIEEAGEPDQDLWQAIVDLGWLGLPLAEEYGGQAASLLDLSILLEEICRAALLSPYPQTMLCALTIQRHGNRDLRRSVLPRICQGLALTPAFFEESDRLYAVPTTTYGDGRVTGDKHFVEWGSHADMYLVTAVEDGIPGLALVPRNQLGVSHHPLRSIGGTPQAVVTCHDAETEGWLPGAGGVTSLRQLGGAMASLESYAYAQKALDMTVDYAGLRVQFGRPIGAFGAVQTRCADMATIVEASKFLSRELLDRLGWGEVDEALVATAKAVTARMAPEVAMEAHLLHGGIGFMREYSLQLYTRRAKEASLRWGTAAETLTAVGDALLLDPAQAELT